MSSISPADRTLISDLLIRYAYSIDNNDVDGAVSCFTPTAWVSWSGGEVVLDGIDQIRGYLGITVPKLSHTTHFVGNIWISMVDGVITAESRVIAALPVDGIVRIRGTAMRDELVKTARKWKITRREHWALWQIESDRISPF